MEDLWTILADGGDKRDIIELNNHGTPGMTLGKQLANDLGFEIGDTVGVSIDEDERTMTVHFGPER